MPVIQLRRNDNDLSAITTAGTAASTAVLLTGGINILTTASSQTGGILPTKAVGTIVVRNSTATTGIIYPPTLGSINGGTVTTGGFNLAQNKLAVFYPHPNGLDYTGQLGA